MPATDRASPAAPPSLLTPEILAYVGLSNAPELACDPVEQGAVRRFAQAIMDADPDYGPAASHDAPWGGPIAPPLFANHAIRRPFGAPDMVQDRAGDPHFDGSGGQPGGLPPIEPLKDFAVLNGGAEFELYRYARHGEHIRVTQRYADITEKLSSKGSMILVTVEAEFRTGDDELLLRARRTLIRRPA
ncbi:MAG: MaoC family dehydratase N-terminal domain-containing protein [Gammaproteobacteria bacterium]|nr:MaoC family dehydratase N-terminal domain-containing protein [Gammaproteobacteria bacterium]MBU1440221.1 MaoC family dehydratase N-terminal domain-containing protein [Gammaproteobacteria bacterium]MBU2285530.1 MaoC family dehydratase N-terminal domain-containing protein [Gammaproteobacteria bacterium]MBU2408248.1 MaoC family dehydratase N-terminal domain-containing protein [Gammaproteobacteria bacterium]